MQTHEGEGAFCSLLKSSNSQHNTLYLQIMHCSFPNECDFDFGHIPSVVADMYICTYAHTDLFMNAGFGGVSGDSLCF